MRPLKNFEPKKRQLSSGEAQSLLKEEVNMFLKIMLLYLLSFTFYGHHFFILISPRYKESILGQYDKHIVFDLVQGCNKSAAYMKFLKFLNQILTFLYGFIILCPTLADCTASERTRRPNCGTICARESTELSASVG